jgi:hypothetical protein
MEPSLDGLSISMYQELSDVAYLLDDILQSCTLPPFDADIDEVGVLFHTVLKCFIVLLLGYPM